MIQDGLLIIALTVASFAAMFTLEHYTPPLPVVYWSVSQDKCEKIVNAPMGYDCDNLPLKYDPRWVE